MIGHDEKGRAYDSPPRRASILAWQQDCVVGEIERDFRQRKIRERDVLDNTTLPFPSSHRSTASPPKG
jgi:hypothetical protein